MILKLRHHLFTSLYDSDILLVYSHYSLNQGSESTTSLFFLTETCDSFALAKCILSYPMQNTNFHPAVQLHRGLTWC